MVVSATPCMQGSTKAIGRAARFPIMTRLARVIAVDVPHHVTQRGNARRFILDCDADRMGISIFYAGISNSTGWVDRLLPDVEPRASGRYSSQY
jgi:hypothetical protein